MPLMMCIVHGRTVGNRLIEPRTRAIPPLARGQLIVTDPTITMSVAALEDWHLDNMDV